MKCFIKKIQQQNMHSIIAGFQWEVISLGFVKSLQSEIIESAYQVYIILI